MNTKTVQKEQVSIVNDEWPALGLGELNEISNGRFKIARKASSVNIEQLTESLGQDAKKDDAIIQRSINKDEILINKNITTNKLKVTKSKKSSDIKESSFSIDDKNLKNLTEEIKKVNQANQAYAEPAKIKLNETEYRKEEVVTRAIPVNPQTTSVTTSPINSGLRKTSNKELSGNALLKFIAVGFGHLFVKSTNDVLKPLGFVANNLSKVLIALMHLSMPLVMTYLLTQKISFIENQITNQSPFLSLLSYGVFYVACLFLWVAGVVIGKGLIKVGKKTLDEVAEIGKENR